MRSSSLATVVVLALALSAPASFAETPTETAAAPVAEMAAETVAEELAPAAEMAAEAEREMTAPAAEMAAEAAGEMTAPAAEMAAEAVAEEVAPAAEMAAEMAAEAVAQEVAPAAEMADEAVAKVAAPAKPASPLGPVGYDAEGRPGRIHVVQRGDTLWDISDAYLGTPWVWPSIWTDNAVIENPHLIRPGDRIWITPEEMRRVTEEEAARLLAGDPGPTDSGVPAAFDDATAAPRASLPGATYRFADVATTGFVSVDAYGGAASIIDAATLKTWLSDPDPVEIGFGRQEVAVGDQFEIFRAVEEVVDPQTGQLYGYATKVLGWLEVEAVHEESATARIRASQSEIRRGDSLLPRVKRNPDIPVAARPEGVEGLIVHTPDSRLEMATSDVVYLNRGTAHGLEIGSPLEVFRPLGSGMDTVRGDERKLRDHVVAKLLVVDTTSDTSVAVVTHAEIEVNRGDQFRGSDSLGW